MALLQNNLLTRRKEEGLAHAGDRFKKWRYLNLHRSHCFCVLENCRIFAFTARGGNMNCTQSKLHIMLGNIKFHNPTKLYFGKDALRYLAKELQNYGPTVMLSYGGGSIKRNGIYNQVMQVLREAGKTVVEDSGVTPNPTVEKLREGAQRARQHAVDLILAVGGGSTIDYAKGVSASAYCDEDPWEKYYIHQENPTCKIIPVGNILTMVGTGSEMNGGSVITNHGAHLKIGKVFGFQLMPRFAILNPEFTYSVPQYQMVAGFFDIMSHILEQYCSGTDDNTSDYIAEGLMRSLISSTRVAAKHPNDYEARSNIMWTATWALNTLLKCGKTQDWMVHMIGQSVGAYTDATHGMTLSAVSLPYYRHIMEAGLAKFRRLAINVWDVDAAGKTDRQIAEEGLKAMEGWMKEIGVVLHLSELGVQPEMFDGIAQGAFICEGGYKKLDHAEIVQILQESM